MTGVTPSTVVVASADGKEGQIIDKVEFLF